MSALFRSVLLLAVSAALCACQANRDNTRREARRIERAMVADQDLGRMDEAVTLYRKAADQLRKAQKKPELERVPTKDLRVSWEPDIARLLLLDPRLKETRDVAELRRRAAKDDLRALYLLSLRYDPDAAFLDSYVPPEDPRAIGAKRGVVPSAGAAADGFRKVALAKSALSCRAALRLAALQIRHPDAGQGPEDARLSRLTVTIRSAVAVIIDDRSLEAERAEAADLVRQEGLRAAPALIKVFEESPARVHPLLVELSGVDLPAELGPWENWLETAP